MEESNIKQVPLRLSQELYDELVKWSEEEFRSVNGQIEYLLTLAVKSKKDCKTKVNLEENK